MATTVTVVNASLMNNSNQRNFIGRKDVKPVLMSWSGGKDSCLALYEIRKSSDYRVAALLTTITREYDPISMHGVRRALLERQATSLGLPLHQVLISKAANNEEYETKMAQAFDEYREDGIDSVIFGDLFLEDIRAYRDRFLARHKMKGLYSVWQRNTTEFIKEFIELGFKAVLSCVDSRALDKSFAGKKSMKTSSHRSQLTLILAEKMESSILLCMTAQASLNRWISVGEAILREGFWFRDLVSCN